VLTPAVLPTPTGRGTRSVTPDLKRFPLSINLAIKFWDTMGWTSSDYNRGELEHVIGGHIPHGFLLDRPFSTATPGFVYARVHIFSSFQFT
jgi:hypothetical protein